MSVTVDRRAFLAAEYRDAATPIDAAVLAVHPLAPQIVEITLLQDANDALTEANRRQAIRAVGRRWFQVKVDMTAANLAVDIGNVISLTHPRYGLQNGQLFRVLGIQPDAQANTILFTVWG